jgi:hypothetical protein
MQTRRSVRAAFGLVAMAIAAWPGLPATGAQQTLADIDITGVSVNSVGAARVVGAYVCPPGFSSGSSFDATGRVEQQLPHRYLSSESVSFAPTVCDGTGQPFVLSFPADLDGQPFRRGVPVLATVSIYTTDAAGDSASAYHQTAGGGGNTAVANIEVGEVGFTGAGAVRVAGTYICPIGDTGTSTFALVSQLVGRGAYKVRHFDRRLDCDGTWNPVAIRFTHTRLGEPFVPDVMNSVQLSFSAESADGVSTQASDQDTMVISG